MSEFFKFPDNFLWGAATASHQVEGNNRSNDWWSHEVADELPYKSGQACDHYSRYLEDFDLAKSLGHNAHRLSIEWSRIEPEEGQFDEAEISHYAEVVQSLNDRNLEPLVTLHHFTNPLWFAKRGGWLQKDAVRIFARYVDTISKRLKNVRYWITVNEPTVYIKNGYGVGCWPPFQKNQFFKASKLMIRFAKAHLAAYETIHENQAHAHVGFAHSAPHIVPCDATSRSDRTVAGVRDFLLNDVLMLLVTSMARWAAGKRPFDFVGLNYYTRTIVRYQRDGIRRLIGQECLDSHHADLGEDNELGWLVYPPGIYAVAKKFARYGVPIIITENGLATEDDSKRSDFILHHIEQLARAIKEGIDIRGYLHWTLMDNFEWAHGANAHFGLAAIDEITLKRTPRQSASVYASICQSNGIYLKGP